MILQSWLLLPWLIMRQNCGGLVKFFENTKTLLIIMWSKPNIHITELPLSSPVEGTYIKLGQGIGETHIQLGEKLNIAAWKFYLLFARVKMDSPLSGLLDQVLFFSRMNQMLCRKNKCMRPVSAHQTLELGRDEYWRIGPLSPYWLIDISAYWQGTLLK